jgi:hypothetical protein
MKHIVCFRWIGISFVLAMLCIAPRFTVTAHSSAEPRKQVTDAALRLVQFCIDPRVGLDEHDIATLADYVLSSKPDKEHALPESQGCPGAYQEFDTKTNFSRFMDYSYNPLIPAVVTRPSSLRYSLWGSTRGKSPKLPAGWKPVPSGGSPMILHGLQHDSNTPDLTTGVYYEYDLKRTLIVANYKGRQVLVSISKQIDKSRIGEKGFILGNDSDWSYYYSGEQGSAKAGLGWIESYIYDYYSVGIYLESGSAPVMLRTGVFQWIKAGWMGVNFVKPSHIIDGLKRFARNNKAILESSRLPASTQMISVYQWLVNLPIGDLRQKYAALQQAQRSSAIQTGKLSKSKADEPLSLAKTTKEQMVEELMLEYVKMALGKPTPMKTQLTRLFPEPLT